MSLRLHDALVVFEVVKRGPGSWQVSANGVDDQLPFSTSEAACAAARLRARQWHLDTGVPTEVHAPNRSGEVECLIRYLRPDDLDVLCQFPWKWHASRAHLPFGGAQGTR